MSRPVSPQLAAAKATEAVITGSEVKHGQALAVVNTPTPFRADVTFEQVRASMYDFAYARDWFRYHTPRNIALALTGEVGELCEILMWRGDEGAKPGLPGWSDADKVHLGEELSDVLLYLTRLADTCGIDLPAAALRKMERNAAKYPADKCKGKSDKYTAYAGDGTAAASSATTTAVVLKPSARMLMNGESKSNESTAVAPNGSSKATSSTSRVASSESSGHQWFWDGLDVVRRLATTAAALFSLYTAYRAFQDIERNSNVIAYLMQTGQMGGGGAGGRRRGGMADQFWANLV